MLPAGLADVVEVGGVMGPAELRATLAPIPAARTASQQTREDNDNQHINTSGCEMAVRRISVLCAGWKHHRLPVSEQQRTVNRTATQPYGHRIAWARDIPAIPTRLASCFFGANCERQYGCEKEAMSHHGHELACMQHVESV